MENKIADLANIIVDYSLKIKERDRVLITYESLEPKELIKYLINNICARDAIPFVKVIDKEIDALIKEKLNPQIIDEIIKRNQFDVDNYDCFITIRYALNDYEDMHMNFPMIKILGDKSRPINDIRINERRWVLLNYPSVLDAYKAKMTRAEYYNYAFEVMTVNYEQLGKNIEPLKELMSKTDQVHITASGTDLTFSIKGMPIIPCVGHANIPDGEIYTAPIKESVNGYITYNTPSPYLGNVFHHIKLTFKDGKIIEATCDEGNEVLNKIFDSDEGARYIGEFSLGVNPKIKHPMGDILYDEKIIGSLHFTPGRAYRDADNGNNSSIHWDLVLIQRPEYGGGNVYFDNVLIRENGFFVPQNLKILNE